MVNTLTKPIEISVPTDSRLTKNGMKGTHGRTLQRITKSHRATARALAQEVLADRPDWESLAEAEVYITSYYPRTPMDYDGLACAVAPAVDGMVDAGVLEDDSPRCIKVYKMRFVKVGTVSEKRVVISVAPCQYDRPWGNYIEGEEKCLNI